MKKNLMIVVLSLAMVLMNANVVGASSNKDTNQAGDSISSSNKNSVYQKLPNYDGKDVVIIEGYDNSDSNSINLFEMKNGKLVKTGDKVSQYSNHYMLFWKADPVKVNGVSCWKIGENLFINSSRVSRLDVQKIQESGQEISHYGNYSEGNKEVNTIKVNNSDNDSVPVMSLQNNGSFALKNDKALYNGSVWKTDKVRKYNGNIYSRIVANE